MLVCVCLDATHVRVFVLVQEQEKAAVAAAAASAASELAPLRSSLAATEAQLESVKQQLKTMHDLNAELATSLAQERARGVAGEWPCVCLRRPRFPLSAFSFIYFCSCLYSITHE